MKKIKWKNIFSPYHPRAWCDVQSGRVPGIPGLKALIYVSALPPCRMENSESSSSLGSLAAPDRGKARPSGPSGQLSESARPSKHREHRSKSPRRRREGKRPQRRGDGHEQLLWETERRRLPGQHEHLEPSGSASDTAESSPKRFALQVASWSAMPLEQVCCPGHEGMVSWFFFSLLTGERTFYMDRIQPLTSDPKPVFFPTQLQSCEHECLMSQTSCGNDSDESRLCL